MKNRQESFNLRHWFFVQYPKLIASSLHFFGVLLLITYSQRGVGQTLSTDKNAITTSKFRVASTNLADASDPTKAMTTIQYKDGLGRDMQNVGFQQTPNRKDLISGGIDYDASGRPYIQYLPVPNANNLGQFQSNLANTGQIFYGDTKAFSEIMTFDNSPLNRPRQSFGAGQAWRTADKKTRQFDEVAGTNIRRYIVDNSGNIILTGNYVTSSLFKTRTIDEQGNTHITIKNRYDNIIQEQQLVDGEYLTTHYIYDDLGRAVAIIQPEGYNLNQTISYNTADYFNYVFAYQYDERGRVHRKHIPSAGWTDYVFDKTNQVVLEQNAQQATQNKWNFTKYDVFGRVAIKGELSNSNGRATLQGLFDGVATPYETWTGSTYTSQSFPITYGSTDEKQWFFYDGYNWASGTLLFDASLAYDASNYWSNTTGLPTGSWARSLDDPTMLFYTVMHYDNKGRVMQTFQTHHRGGSQPWTKPIITNFQYNFAGEIIREKTIYKADNEADKIKEKYYNYDHAGRKLAYELSLGNYVNTRIANYEFDEISRLKRKVFMPNGTFIYGGAKDYIIRPSQDGTVSQNNTQDIARKAVILEPISNIKAIEFTSYLAQIDPNAQQGTTITGLQKIDYQYHIRGGLLGINLDANKNVTLNSTEVDLFSYKLDYETAGQWSGNIGKETWKSSKNTGSDRSYSYQYDAAQRILSAIYAGGQYANENYGVENISYDKNGNIKTFWRKGMTTQNNGLPTTFDYIDKMTYGYVGNKLVAISDGINNNIDVGDFRDINNGSGSDYTYWANGSLKTDVNRGISLITWDTFLNKIKRIDYADGRWLVNYYDGAGRKYKTADSEGTIWEYLGDEIYKNGVFYQFSDDEGRITYENGNGSTPRYNYEFSYKDHLGNSRVSFKAVGNELKVSQENAYYPFGLSHIGTDFTLGANSNNFLYNGKEKINSFGLNYSDYGFRTYDLLTNRFISTDPIAFKFPELSTYQYGSNNPITNIDFDGLEGLYYTEKQSDGTQKQVVEKNVVVLTQQPKAIPEGASEKQISRIERQNANIEKANEAKIEAVKDELNQYYSNAQDENGNPVEFRFNVSSLKVADTSYDTPNRSVPVISLGIANGLKSSETDLSGNNVIVPAAVVTTGGTNGSLGLSNGVYVNSTSNSPSGTIAHEVLHTFLVKDNSYTQGGLLNSPPQNIISSEVKQVINLSKKK